jgi:predicted ATP-grasp superfamily ATP-dependent carboligase
MTCPNLEANPDDFIAWLLMIGELEPGQVLMAASDDLAYLFSQNRDALRRKFRLDVPRIETSYPLLNKWRLYEACGALGIATPPSVLPLDDRDLVRAGEDIGFPLLIKPQTQVGLRHHRKGRVVGTAEELPAAYAEFQAATAFWSGLRDFDPGVSRPLLQTYVGSAANGIFNLSGFIGREGEPFVVLGSRKLLQRPRRLGVGLCFEEAEPAPALVGQLERLCRHVGYHGVFEVEFLEVEGRHLLIDFNPRFFGQMAFDIARGVDLPLLAYRAATGDREGLAAAVRSAAAATTDFRGRVFCNRAHMRTHLALSRLAGAMGRTEASDWRSWLVRHRGHVIDPSVDEQDWLPRVVDVVRSVVMPAIHPRSTWRDARKG